MKISKNGIDLIKRFEGLRLTSYTDSIGVWTIGYGSTLGVEAGMTIDQAEADRLLLEDLEEAQRCISDKVSVILNQNQFDALCSWIFNLGCGNFSASSMRRCINEGDFASAVKEMVKWNHAGGKVLEGLTKRRDAEAALFSTPDPDATNPHA